MGSLSDKAGRRTVASRYEYQIHGIRSTVHISERAFETCIGTRMDTMPRH
jgi:hypothetical protein